MTTYTLTAEQRGQLMTDLAKAFISSEALKMLQALQPNTQEPVAYVSRIAENGRADINWLQGVSVGDKLFTHPAPQQPAEVAALQAKVNAAEARERQTRATLHKYMANQQQAEPVSHETFDVSGDKTPLHEVESMITNALAAHRVKPCQ